MKGYPIREHEDIKISDVLQDSDSKLDLNHFFNNSNLHVEGYEEDDDGRLLLYSCSADSHGVCPYCQSVSHKVHSSYMRRLQDLAAFGQNVVLCFRARKFFCPNTTCRYRTFAEQPGNEIFRYRRRTRRCEVLVHRQGLHLSSINASSMLVNMGIRISRSTVLRDLHRLSVPECMDVRKIGVDDRAFRKGIDYGTIIIDLSRRIPVDLLGTRSGPDFSDSLTTHQDIRLVSRDRSTEYSRRRKSYVNEVRFNEVKRPQKEGKSISETDSLLGRETSHSHVASLGN